MLVGYTPKVGLVVLVVEEGDAFYYYISLSEECCGHLNLLIIETLEESGYLHTVVLATDDTYKVCVLGAIKGCEGVFQNMGVEEVLESFGYRIQEYLM